jgi:hypothetical protein
MGIMARQIRPGQLQENVLYNISASYAISASHEIVKEVSSSYADTASFAQSGNGIFSGSFSGSFQGDGSGITGVTASFVPAGLGGIYGGSGTVPTSTIATITDSLTFSGSINVTDTVFIGNVTPSINSSASIYIVQPSASSSTESPIIRVQVEDALSQLRLDNFSGTDGLFVPRFLGIQNDTSAQPGMYIDGVITGSLDTGLTPALIFRALRSDAGVGDEVTSRNLFQWRNFNSPKMTMDTNGNLGIGIATPNYKLDVNGTTNINGATTITGSLTATGLTQGAGTNTVAMYDTGSGQFFYTSSAAIGGGGSGTGFPFSGSAVITGSLLISSSTNQQLTLLGSGSDQPIFLVQGSAGELFSISDSLSGSLFAVNNISGLPILEVFSDDRIIQGDYTAPMLTTTVKNTVSSAGAFTVYELPTASYDGAFFEYTARSGSNARAGQIMSIWSGSQVNFTETATTDFGSTTGLSFIVTVTGSNFALTGSVTTADWTIKTIVRSI